MHLRYPQHTQVRCPWASCTSESVKARAADVNLHVDSAPVRVITEVYEVPSEEGPGDNYGIIITLLKEKDPRKERKVYQKMGKK